MTSARINPEHADVRRQIASKLRRNPKLVRVFAERLRSQIASTAEVSDDHWEWYFILTLWPPVEVIKLLEDSSESAVRLRWSSALVSLLSEKDGLSQRVVSL
jgi:hypothetical protein